MNQNTSTARTIHSDLEPRMRELVDLTVDWILRYQLYDSVEKALEQAIVAVTFSDWTSPSNSTQDQLILSAKCLSVFLYFDDLDGPAREKFVEHARPLMGAERHRDCPIQILALADYLDHLGNYGDPAPFVARFTAAFEMYLRESNLDIASLRTTAEADRIHSATIFVAEYTANWKIAMGLMDLCGYENLEEASVKLVYLVNDIASIARDQQDGSVNYVLALQAERGLSIAEASQEVVAQVSSLYDELVKARVKEPDNRLIEFLCADVEGNIYATAELSKLRYGNLPAELLPVCQLLQREDRSCRWINYDEYFKTEGR